MLGRVIYGIYMINKTVSLINNYFSDYDTEVDLNIYFIDENGKDIKDKKIYKISKIKSDEIFLVEKILGNYGNHFLHLEYSYEGMTISTNTYILSEQMDVINYNATPTFYNVPIISYADFKFLNNLENVTLTAEVISKTDFVENGQNKERYIFKIKNEGKTIALLLEIKLYQISGNDKEIVVPIIWSDNYFSIRGENSYEITAEFSYDKNKELHLDIVGWNCELKKKLN